MRKDVSISADGADAATDAVVAPTRADPRLRMRLLVAVATFAAVVLALWTAHRLNPPAGPRDAAQVRSIRADARPPQAATPEELDVKAAADLEETRAMIAKMKAHGIGE